MAISTYTQAVNAYNQAKNTNVSASMEEIGGQDKSAGPAFAELVGDALRQSAAIGYESEAKSIGALTGETELQDLVTAVNEAELALNTVVSVRDKVIGAYEDIIRMPM